MRRPTIKQLEIVRSIAGNGWGDGDYLQSCTTAKEAEQTLRALKAFEKWIEDLQGAQFANPIIAGKNRNSEH